MQPNQIKLKTSGFKLFEKGELVDRLTLKEPEKLEVVETEREHIEENITHLVEHLFSSDLGEAYVELDDSNKVWIPLTEITAATQLLSDLGVDVRQCHFEVCTWGDEDYGYKSKLNILHVRPETDEEKEEREEKLALEKVEKKNIKIDRINRLERELKHLKSEIGEK
jgi:hypothetical protein